MALTQSAVKDVIPDVGVHFALDENVLKGLNNMSPIFLPCADWILRTSPGVENIGRR
jgi:hypothetical protein